MQENTENKDMHTLKKTGNVGNRNFNNVVQVHGFKANINKDGFTTVPGYVAKSLLGTGKFVEVKEESDENPSQKKLF